MRLIKHVKSMEHYGCAITCIAMIARISYWEVREKLSKVSLRHHSKLMDLRFLQMQADEIYDLLRTHFNIRCRGVKFIEPMKNHCILFITPIYLSHSGHAVVWDAKQKKILDPDGEIINLDNFNIYYCIEILPNKRGLEVEQRNEEKYWRFNGVGPRVRLIACKKSDKFGIEYIYQDLLLTKSDMALLSRTQRMARLTKAIGLTEFQIKQELHKSGCIR